MKTIPLSQGKVALVDDADFEVVNAHKWQAMKNGRRFYAVRTIKKLNGRPTTQYLHQFLLPGASRIDHRDGDGLNNQRHNLRAATHTQNLQGFQHKRFGTTSKYRGVSWNRQMSKWSAQIYVEGKQIRLGLFTDEKDAASAYDAAALRYFDFPHLNFP